MTKNFSGTTSRGALDARTRDDLERRIGAALDELALEGRLQQTELRRRLVGLFEAASAIALRADSIAGVTVGVPLGSEADGGLAAALSGRIDDLVAEFRQSLVEQFGDDGEDMFADLARRSGYVPPRHTSSAMVAAVGEAAIEATVDRFARALADGEAVSEAHRRAGCIDEGQSVEAVVGVPDVAGLAAERAAFELRFGGAKLPELLARVLSRFNGVAMAIAAREHLGSRGADPRLLERPVLWPHGHGDRFALDTTPGRRLFVLGETDPWRGASVDGLVALDVTTGAVVWRSRGDGPLGTASAELAVAHSLDHFIERLSAASGCVSALVRARG